MSDVATIDVSQDPALFYGDPPAPKANGNGEKKAEAPKADAIMRIEEADAGFTTASGFALLQRGATLLAASTLVPEAYRGKLANCVIALNMAQRMGADPLMVMQNLYVVHGNPGWSAKFLIATVNQCGRFTALRYEHKGEEGQPDRGCRAWAVEKATREKLYGPWVTMKMAADEQWSTKSGSKWKTMPELMLMYRAAAFWQRTHAPELAMGLQTVEELHDVIDAQEVRPGVYEAQGAARQEGQGGKLDRLADQMGAGPA